MSKSSPVVTAHAGSPINNFAVTASAASGVGHSANVDKANSFDISDAANAIPSLSTSGSQAQAQVLAPVASLPIKKAVKMRPGSSNTPR